MNQLKNYYTIAPWRECRLQ